MLTATAGLKAASEQLKAEKTELAAWLSDQKKSFRAHNGSDTESDHRPSTFKTRRSNDRSPTGVTPASKRRSSEDPFGIRSASASVPRLFDRNGSPPTSSRSPVAGPSAADSNKRSASGHSQSGIVAPIGQSSSQRAYPTGHPSSRILLSIGHQSSQSLLPFDQSSQSPLPIDHPTSRIPLPIPSSSSRPPSRAVSMGDDRFAVIKQMEPSEDWIKMEGELMTMRQTLSSLLTGSHLTDDDLVKSIEEQISELHKYATKKATAYQFAERLRYLMFMWDWKREVEEGGLYTSVSEPARVALRYHITTTYGKIQGSVPAGMVRKWNKGQRLQGSNA